MRLLLAIFVLQTSYAFADARAILEELIAVDTTNPPGNEGAAAQVVKKRLDAAGLKSEIVEFAPGRANLVARLKGDGSKKPLLLLAHLDVVPAANQPWTVPPFKLTEKNGWLYGRGVLDDKGWAAVATALFLELAQSKARLKRDVVLALTGDEESGGDGIKHLLATRKDLLGDVEIALNEGGSLTLDEKGRVVKVSYQPAEKTYQSYELAARGLGGHSSVPNDENAIYRLARALDKLAAHKFAPRLSATVRESLRAWAASQPEPRASALRVVAEAREPPADALLVLDAYPLTRAAIRTTCVATKLAAGTAENALAVEARATVNCRVMPEDKVADVERVLRELDKSIEVKPLEDQGFGPASPVDGLVPAALRKVARARFGEEVKVTPVISPGATDSRFLRRAGVLSYGVGLLAKPEELLRAPHGPDEGAPAASLANGVEWLRALVTELAQ